MAKRFRFNLDAVLRYREILEDEAKREYLEFKRRIEEERARRDDLDRQRGELQDEIVTSFSEGAPIQSIQAAYSLIGKLEAAKAESLQRERQLEIQAEEKRQAMITASQKKKVMETLKENRRLEFMQELDKKEQDFLDEMSIQAQGRRLRKRKADAEEAEAEEEARALLARLDGPPPVIGIESLSE